MNKKEKIVYGWGYSKGYNNGLKEGRLRRRIEIDDIIKRLKQMKKILAGGKN
jgi:hypothetical protein